MFFCSRMCGHSRLWALDMHTNKYVCSEAPAHCNKHSCVYLSMCSYVHVKTLKQTHSADLLHVQWGNISNKHAQYSCLSLTLHAQHLQH